MTDIVRRTVSKAVMRLGYHLGRSRNWYKDFPEMIHVIGLQKSRWGGEYYLEVGIWLKMFGPDEKPRFSDCHIRLRMDETFGLEVNDLHSALWEEDSWKMDPSEREFIIYTALRGVEGVLLSKVQTLDQLKDFLSVKQKPFVLVAKEAHELLQLPPN